MHVEYLEKNLELIENISVADCFIYNSNLHIRANDSLLNISNKYNQYPVVDLESGRLLLLAGGTFVKKVNVEIVVTDNIE